MALILTYVTEQVVCLSFHSGINGINLCNKKHSAIPISATILIKIIIKVCYFYIHHMYIFKCVYISGASTCIHAYVYINSTHMYTFFLNLPCL